jgi:uncharacterized membrane protein
MINNKHPILKQRLRFSQRAAYYVAKIVGSWRFIIILIFILIFWMGINIYFLLKPFDPYPFILLNLWLSCLAAFQAPVILMSQNRQAERDRIDARYDYQVNRKAEREIEDIQKDLEEIKNLIKKIK